jgi:hypothetical protein
MNIIKLLDLFRFSGPRLRIFNALNHFDKWGIKVIMTINLISSFIKLNSSNPSNLLDDCKALKDLTAVYRSI